MKRNLVLAAIAMALGSTIPLTVHGQSAGRALEDAGTMDKIEPVYEKLPGWKQSTEGIVDWDKLPKKARNYLEFLEKESGAKIGMVSTGPDREQTMFTGGFDKVVGL